MALAGWLDAAFFLSDPLLSATTSTITAAISTMVPPIELMRVTRLRRASRAWRSRSCCSSCRRVASRRLLLASIGTGSSCGRYGCETSGSLGDGPELPRQRL